MCDPADEETTLLQEDGKHTTQRETTSCTFQGRIVTGSVGFLLAILVMKLKVVIEKGNTSNVAVPVQKYKRFQALNFQVYTGGAPVFIEDENGVNITNPECTDLNFYGSTTENVLSCYAGHENTTKDVENRLSIMFEAVERAYEFSAKDEDVLKVFVAPEFFFRGRNGAYLIASREAIDKEVFDDNDGDCEEEICRILQGLENFVAQKRFENWLFLFGTVVVAEVLPVEDTWDYLFYNFGLIYKGYDPSEMTHIGKRFIVPKRYVSNIDFLTPRRDFKENEAREIFESTGATRPSPGAIQNPRNLDHKYYDRRLWSKYKDEVAKLDYTMIEYGWFLMDGHTFTVEICLDHKMQTALTAYLVNAGRAESTPIPSSHDGKVEYVEIPTHQAQLSIVSSAGMSIKPKSLALANEGWIILQDGLWAEDSTMQWEFDCDTFDWEFDGGSEVAQRNSTMTPTEVLFTYQLHRDYQKFSLNDDDWRAVLLGTFATTEYEPKLIVYEPKKIVGA